LILDSIMNLVKGKTDKTEERGERGVCFLCPKCGPLVPMLTEVWGEGQEGPYKIELYEISEEMGMYALVTTIELNDKPDGFDNRFNHCGICDHLLWSIPKDLDHPISAYHSLLKIEAIKSGE